MMPDRFRQMFRDSSVAGASIPRRGTGMAWLLVVACGGGAGADGSVADSAGVAVVDTTRGGITVEYLANEGVLIGVGEEALLIDGLFGDGLPQYPAVAPATRDSLERAVGRFRRIRAALVTHVHRDHFDARAAGRFLTAHPHALLVAPAQVVDSLLAGMADSAGVRSRIHALRLAPGATERVTVGGFEIQAVGLVHPPSRNQPVELVGYRVRGDGVEIAHLGDASPEPAELVPFRGVDRMLAPWWVLTGAGGAERHRAIAAGGWALFHLARETTAAEVVERLPEGIRAEVLDRPGMRLEVRPAGGSRAGDASPAATAQIPPRAHHQLVHHASQGRVYLIGGSTPGEGGHRTFDDVWSWDGEAWRPAPPLPFPRSSHRVVYEPAGESLLLFGGMDGDSVSADGVVWRWRSEEWVERAEVPEAGRNEPGACMDTARDRLVLFGGADRQRALIGSTWEWDGSDLREIASEGPGARIGHGMAWDPVGRRCLLFGGRDPDGVIQGDTWAWDGAAWSRLDVEGPAARFIFSMTDDGERVLLFGGQDGDEELLGDTWSWDGEAWTRIATDGPDPRMMAAMAFDGRGVLLFGGRGRGVDSRYRDRGDTWRLEGDRWRLLIPAAEVRALAH